MTEVVAFLILVGFVAVVGIGLGMLVAPRLTRWTERDERDEDERDEDEPDHDEPDEEQRDDGPG
jgi:flagellar biosynthesis/type III secretory pathway M-ring protein FliF/YscJ